MTEKYEVINQLDSKGSPNGEYFTLEVDINPKGLIELSFERDQEDEGHFYTDWISTADVKRIIGVLKDAVFHAEHTVVG